MTDFNVSLLLLRAKRKLTLIWQNESIFMEAQTTQWENANPQRIAFIER